MDPTPDNFKAISSMITELVSGVGNILASTIAVITAYQAFLKARYELRKKRKRKKPSVTSKKIVS